MVSDKFKEEIAALVGERMRVCIRQGIERSEE